MASAVTLGPGEVIAVRANVNEKSIDRVDARLTATPSEFSVHGRIDCADETTAKMVVAQKDMAMDMLDGVAGTPEAKEIVKSISVRQEGKSLVVDMGVKGDAHAQAQYVSTLAAAAIGGFRQYMMASKTAEARSNVGAIAMGLSSYAEQHGKFPASAPAVPKDAPKAQPYQSSPSDWAAPSWKAIQFNLDAPQRYSYAFNTAKDGRSTTVVAHGDLNGDGKPSTFELKLDIEKDKHIKRGRLVVKDELE
jgi:hypothetical protein